MDLFDRSSLEADVEYYNVSEVLTLQYQAGLRSEARVGSRDPKQNLILSCVLFSLSLSLSHPRRAMILGNNTRLDRPEAHLVVRLPARLIGC